MKKVILFLLLIIFSVSVVSCGTQIENGNTEIPEDKPEEKPEDKPEDEPGEEPEVNPGDKPEEKPEDKPEEKPQGISLFSHIDELADNVDETPIFEIKTSDIKTASLSYKSNGVNTSEIDITDPSNNSIYQEYLFADRYYWNEDHTRIFNANNFIEQVKLLKEEIISEVKMLNTWIYIPAMSARYRISYNQISDIVYLERLTNIGNQFEYYKISSSYVNKNKMLIDTYQVSGEDGKLRTEHSFHYQEDSILTYYEKNLLGLDNIFLLTADLSVPNPVNISLSYSILDQGDRYVYEMDKYIYQSPSDTSYGIDIFNTYQADYQLTEYYWKNNFTYINNSNNEQVMLFQDNQDNSFYYSIDLYELKGYNKLIRGDNVYRLIIGDKEYQTPNSNSMSSSDMIYYSTDNANYYAYISESSGCNLYVSVDVKTLNTKTREELLLEFMGYLGLSFKDEDIYQRLKVLDDIDEVLSSYSFFNYSSSYEISPIDMEKIYEINKLPSLTIDEIQEYLNSEYVLFDQQVDDESYFLLYSDGVTGTVNISDGMSLDLSNISIQLKNTSIFTVGETYTLKAIIKNDLYSFLLDEKSIIYQGEEVIINLNNNVSLPQNLENGKYTIAAYLSTIANNKELRISGIYTLSGTSYFDRFEVSEVKQKLYLTRIVSLDEVNVLRDDMMYLDGSISFMKENNTIILDGVFANLNNGYALINTDIVSIKGILSNETEVIMTLENTFNFGSDSLNAVLDNFEVPNLEVGSYTLNIEFSIVTKMNEIIVEQTLQQKDKKVNEVIPSNLNDKLAFIKLESTDMGLNILCSEFMKIELKTTQDEEYIYFDESVVDILYPAFFNKTDNIFLDVTLYDELEEINYVVCGFSSFDNFETDFVIPKIMIENLPANSYKVKIDLLVNTENGDIKYNRMFETDIEIIIEETIRETETNAMST